MIRFQQSAAEKGLATLSVDQPGFGESGLTGNRFQSPDDIRKMLRLLLKFAKERSDVDEKRIGAFGLSLGGLVSVMSAGISQDIQVAGGIGTPFDLLEGYLGLPRLLRKRVFQWSGAQTDEQAMALIRRLDVPGHVSKVNIPVLLCHGQNDELVPVKQIEQFRKALGNHGEYRILPKDDHTCSHNLNLGLVDSIFSWYAKNLEETTTS
jgi:dipeptidyl aminopeptidase/acylaminoacyl peptidase